MSELHTVVRRGLAAVLGAHPAWRDEPLLLLRNRLLDECGGDARPYIALVMRAAELDVPSRILDWGGDGVPWSSLRGSLVVSLVSEAFLRSDMAAWVVDAWGAALLGAERLGIVDSSPGPLSIGVPPAASGTDRVPPPSPERRQARRSPPVAAPLPRAPAVASAARVASSGLRATSAPSRNSPGVTVPPTMQALTRGAVVVIVTGLLYLVVQVTRAREAREGAASAAPVVDAPALRRADAPSDSSGAAAVGVGSRAPAPPPASPSQRPGTSTPLADVARGAIPEAANDPARLMVVQPPTRARGQAGPGAAVLETQVAMLATSRADRLELRSGRVLTGRVEVVRASVVVFRDAESGLRYEFAKGDIREITTEFGTKVRFSAEGDPQNERRSPLVARGLAGTYRVHYTFEGVRGSPECRSTAAQQVAPDVMTIQHIPGTDTLTIAIRNGATYYGVVDAEGVFATALALQGDQALESSAYTSRVNGRFTESGFDATFHLIAYRRVRGGRDIACQTTLNARGERDEASRSPGAR